VIRPANYPHANPGKGHLVTEAGGMRVGVVNISGGVGLTVARSPFHEVDSILERIEADCVVVDFHAEVTSEKVAMGWHLDGRVAALFGTHTHVPTADARVLPGGTAVITERSRGQARAGPAVPDHPDAGPIRNRRGGRLGDGRGGRDQLEWTG
jgi:calcineurin-like phosphoesterase